MVLQQLRNDDTFEKLFSEAQEANGEAILMPRITARQQHRNNVPVESAQEYYKRGVFLPFVDTCLSQLEERFRNHAGRALQLSVLLPSFCDRHDFAAIEPAARSYSPVLPEEFLALQTEFLRWKAYWQRQPVDERPSRVVDALRIATALGTYPVITTLLCIFATIPVTNATDERSFSALKYIKHYLRSTMGETRLNGLAHLYIIRDIVLKYDEVINKFGKENHRLIFV